MRAIQFLTPHHDNMGDNAQAYCIYNMLTTFFTEVLRFQLPDTDKGLEQVRPNDIVFLGSGGYLGDLWMKGELERRKIIQVCKDNIVVSFPQTIAFCSTSNEARISADVYKEHPRLFISTRDPESYVWAKTYFPTNYIFQLPDPVFTMSHNTDYEREGVLCIFRNDKEDLLKSDKQDIVMQCEDYYAKVNVIDTEGADGSPQFPIRNMSVNFPRFLDTISKYRLVVTDRFHGTVFAGITGTPCIALPTINHKIVSSVHWYKYLGLNLSVCKDAESFSSHLINEHSSTIYNPAKAIGLYHQVISSVIHTGNVVNLNDTEKVIQHRRTIRKWRPIAIPENILRDIVQTGVDAPSGSNAQCTRFKIIREKSILQWIGNKHKFSTCPPAVIFVGYDFGMSRTINFGHKNPMWEPLKYQDIAAAVENMLLYCESIGLSCCWLSYFPEYMQQFLQDISITDPDIEYISAIAVGMAEPFFKEIDHSEFAIKRKKISHYLR